MPKGSGLLVNGAVLVMDSTGSGAVLNSVLSEFKLVNAVPPAFI